MAEKVVNLECCSGNEYKTRFDGIRLVLKRKKQGKNKTKYSSVYVDDPKKSDTSLVPFREGVFIKRLDSKNGYIYTENGDGFCEVMKIVKQGKGVVIDYVETDGEKSNIISFEQQYKELIPRLGGRVICAYEEEGDKKPKHVYVNDRLLDMPENTRVEDIALSSDGSTIKISNNLGYVCVLKLNGQVINTIVDFAQGVRTYEDISPEIYYTKTDTGYSINTIDGTVLKEDKKIGANIDVKVIDGKTLIIIGTDKQFDDELYVLDRVKKDHKLEKVQVNSGNVKFIKNKNDFILLKNPEGQTIIGTLNKKKLENLDEYALNEIYVANNYMDVNEYSKWYAVGEINNTIVIRKSDTQFNYNFSGESAVTELLGGDLLLIINEHKRIRVKDNQYIINYRKKQEERKYLDKNDPYRNDPDINFTGLEIAEKMAVVSVLLEANKNEEAKMANAEVERILDKRDEKYRESDFFITDEGKVKQVSFEEWEEDINYKVTRAQLVDQIERKKQKPREKVIGEMDYGVELE
ncbi:MAG: hypothetical protein A2Y22_03895 [Clostridiales bacterium GWD2_32_59]|nr:MAG: hypothetical protein A2Y22_03895 [Clostridiales bacterium GWD2_32_59]